LTATSASPSPTNAAQRRKYGLALLLATTYSCLMFAPRIVLDVYGGSTDVAVHYYWGSDYYDALRHGILLPSWASSMYGGLGSPILLPYPPLFYFSASLLTFLTNDFYLSMMLVLAVANLVSGILSFRLLDRFGLTKAAFLAAFLVQTCPLFVVMTTAFNAWPTYMATPILIWFAYASVNMPPKRLLIPSVSVSAAVLVLAHAQYAANVFTCMGIAFLSMGILRARRGQDVSEVRAREVRPVIAWGLSTALGIAVTAFFLLPAILALRQFGHGTLDLSIHWYEFFLLSPVSIWLYGLKWPNVQIVLPSISVLYLAIALVCLRSSGLAKTVAVPGVPAHAHLLLVFASLAATVLMTELSWLAWRYVALVRANQLPTRYLSIAYVFAIFAFLASWYQEMRMNRRAAVVLLTAVLLPTALTIALTIQFFAKDARPRGEFLDMPISVQELNGSGFGRATHFAEGWLDYLVKGGLEGECSEQGITCRTLLSEPHRKEWAANGSADVSALKLPLFWFPNWQVAVDGMPVQPGFSRESGLMTVPVASGDHKILATWDHGRPRQFGIAISAIACTIVVLASTRGISFPGGGRRTRTAG